MDYLFENLGDERFQEFCNCLISKEYNDIQAFPVGQPDGGRDSIVYLRNIRNENFNGFYVFQVKYVRNPYTIQDIHKWFTNIIKEEAPKINKLIPRGAKKYILITNVKGTAHLGAGSIDKVNNILKENINIPSMCWWRDDICIRIEKDPIFKWSFPEILNGQDILNSILFEYISEKREKRESIIKAYLADQYDIDNEVKFKQIDLRNKLLDLFTDVPLRIKDFDDKDKVFRNLIMSLEYSGIHIHKRFDSYGEEKEYSTAANFILSSFAQNSIPKLLLEGGPGQGKSTISQYVCQVHRVRLLNKKNDLNSIPLEFKKSPIRIPIKIDLRHISSWIEHKNPYENILSNEYYNSIWSNSLESFLVGHIVYHSQNRDTTISDIISIMKESAILIVFDGFDEIANIQSRKEVVEFINKGVNRLSQNSKSLQVLITSRPAAFADAIGFSIEDYPHFELTDITSQTINEYVDKWINASQLNRRESIEIKKLVDEKLKLPHLKELAKSPMQLAILISLLRTRGESLPNKRTALYDSYIDLFFNREAEKSTMIRDNRYLIMEIHEYLAWILHSEAELTNSNGTIQLEELKLKLNGYLEKEGHSTELGETLFNVVKERVCALVSRVQGTFEFEVQPLREYFCAKFLYNTAPYSPTGEEKKGTKPDRFDAIARNYYWQNVVRFFSGCFDKGELPMLVDQLIILQEDDLLKYTNYPSLLMSQTLSDWVFSQSPRMSNKIIDKLIEDIKNGKIVEQDEIYGSSFMALPIECGSENISMACLKKLQEFPPKDHVLELANIIRSNLYGVNNFWLDYLKIFKDEELTLWLEYGLYIGLIKKVDSKIILDVINNKGTPTETKKRIQILIRGERFDIINGNIDIKRKALDGILDNKMFIWRKGFHQTSIGLINLIFDPYMLNKIINMEGSSHLPFLSEINSNLNDFEEVHKDISFSNISGESDTIDSLINSFVKKDY